MLPDRSVLRGQKVVEIVKIERFKCDILNDFQTICLLSKITARHFWAFLREVPLLSLLEYQKKLRRKRA